MRELPLNGRNFLQLATLMPGVSAPDFLNVKDKGLLGGSDLSVSGSGVTANLWTVDGANNNDVGSNRTILVYPSVDAIEEFKIQRNNYGAEFGQAGGRADQHRHPRRHQRVPRQRLLLRPQRRAQRQELLPRAGGPADKEQLKRDDFGWHLRRADHQGQAALLRARRSGTGRQRGTVRTAFVPTAAERAGDFSGPRSPGCTRPTPIDPLTGAAVPRQPHPGRPPQPGRPASTCSSIRCPTPRRRREAATTGWTSLDTPHQLARRRTSAWTGRSPTRTRLMVRYTQDTWTNNSPSNVGTSLWGDDPFPAVDSNWDQPGKSFVAQLNQNIGSQRGQHA